MSRLNHIIAITDIDAVHYRFTAVYEQGERLVIDLSQPILAAKAAGNSWLGALADPDFFAQVYLQAPGNPTWPNEVDFCADALYEDRRQRLAS